MIQILASDYLEEAGFNVDSAGSAAEAMNKLALIPGGVDAAIVDMGLPDQKGDALIHEMRTMRPTLPVVVATGQGAESMPDAFKGVPNIAFVQKPYSAAGLLG
jgi:DNA-binding response OmpR family regulator